MPEDPEYLSAINMNNWICITLNQTAHFSPPGLSSGGRLSFFKFFALLLVFVRLRML